MLRTGKLPLLPNCFGQSKSQSQHEFKGQEKDTTFCWEEPKSHIIKGIDIAINIHLVIIYELISTPLLLN